MSESETHKIISRLFSLSTKGMKFGLERMVAASDAIGNPHQSFKIIHVAGTNGKGSICAYCNAMLQELGQSVGLFTSPHLVDFEERFIINGKPITTNDWLPVYTDLESVINQHELTFFEATTLMAFELFKRKGVDWGVIETGLGGRLDSTNIITPAVSIIGQIAFDHMQYLGNSLEQIATEKLGIVKKGVPLVAAMPLQRSIENLIRQRCNDQSTSCIIVEGNDKSYAVTDTAQSLHYHNINWQIPLDGVHQRTNALCAIRAMESAGFNDFVVMKNGLAKTTLPGRFQRIQFKEKTIIFDVGHNPAAAASIVENIARVYPDEKVLFVVGIMSDKDAVGFIQKILPIADTIICTQPQTDRAMSAEALQSLIPPSFAVNRSTIPSVRQAIEQSLNSSNNVICVTGSFFTVGEGMSALGVRPY